MWFGRNIVVEGFELCELRSKKIEDRIRKMDVVETANFTLATHQLKLTGSWEDREALFQNVTFKTFVMPFEEGVTVVRL